MAAIPRRRRAGSRCLGVAVWFIYKQRSRRGLFWLSHLLARVFRLLAQGLRLRHRRAAEHHPRPVRCRLHRAADGHRVLRRCRSSWRCLPDARFAPASVRTARCRICCSSNRSKSPPGSNTRSAFCRSSFSASASPSPPPARAFPICRYDPIVPIFRLNGPGLLIALAALTLVLGMFVGRPYCRFLCPYGALLKLASLASKWRVRVTPDLCTQCQLCANSCPFGAMREPSPGTVEPKFLAPDRRRLGWLAAARAGADRGRRVDRRPTRRAGFQTESDRRTRRALPPAAEIAGGLRRDDARNALAPTRRTRPGGAAEIRHRPAPALLAGVRGFWRLGRVWSSA